MSDVWQGHASGDRAPVVDLANPDAPPDDRPELRPLIAKMLREDVDLSRSVIELAREQVRASVTESLRNDPEVKAAVDDEAVRVVRKIIEYDVLSTLGGFIATSLSDDVFRARMRAAVLRELARDEGFIGLLANDVLTSLRGQLDEDAAIQGLDERSDDATGPRRRLRTRAWRAVKVMALFLSGSALGAAAGFYVSRSI